MHTIRGLLVALILFCGPASAQAEECPSQSDIARIRANPTDIKLLFQSCQSALSARVADLQINAPTDLFAIYVMLVAHRMAPYGHSTVLALDQLLREPFLDCDNYAALAAHLHALGAEGAKGQLALAGFDHGAIGNHAQLFYVGMAPLLLDPTYGIVARTTFDDALMGKPAPVIELLHWKDDMTVVGGARNVKHALLKGKYRPSNLLYFFSDVTRFVAWARIIASRLSTDDADVATYLPTPGFRR